MTERTDRLSWPMLAAVGAMLFVAVLFVFGASLRYGFAMLDDPYLIYNNLAIRGMSVENLKRIFWSYDPELYIPFTLFTYQINYLVSGLDAGSYHFFNLILHTVNAVLVFWLLDLLTNRRWLSLFGALLFALHPLQTEAVVWVAGRKDLLSTMFFLMSAGLYVAHRKGEYKSTRIQEYKGWYWLSVLCFFFALGSKVMVLTLPVTLLLLDWLIEERKWDRAMILDKVPYFVLSLAFAIIAVLGKVRIITSSTWWETVLMAAKSAVFYLEKLFVPSNLTVFYPYYGKISIASSDFFIPIIILLVLAGLMIYALRFTSWIAFGALFFIVTLAPTFLNFSKGEVIYFAVDRYAYLPSIGIILIVILLASMLIDRFDERRVGTIFLLAGSLLVVILGFFTSRQTQVWASDEELFGHALKLYPASIPARTNMAVIYRQKGDLEHELAVLKGGLKYGEDVSLHTGIGSVYARQAKISEAIAEYEKAKQIDPKNPEPYFFLGSLAEDQKDIANALKNYNEALKRDSSYSAVYVNRGGIFFHQGKLEEAYADLTKALWYNPNIMEAQYNLFQVLEAMKKHDEAIVHLEKAYELSPDSTDIILNIAYVFIEQKRFNEAKKALEHGLELEPQNAAMKRMMEHLKVEQEKGK